jgi:hypothetical protein
MYFEKGNDSEQDYHIDDSGVINKNYGPIEL